MKYNLSTICRTANRFHKAGYSRSTAFILAWRLAKETACTKIAGTRFAVRQDALAQLTHTDPETVAVELCREQGNAFDPHAVAVLVSSCDCSCKLGYLPTRAARLIAPLMDAGERIRCRLSRIIGGWASDINYGAQINMAI